jgi:dipeptidyl aminopeptidase/acylaminoacyl peptidase
MLRVVCAGLLLSAAALPAGAQVAPTQDLEAKLFGARESATGVDVSPDGSRIVFIAPAPNAAAVAMTADLATGQVKPFLTSTRSGERLRWCEFVTNERLICQFSVIISDTGMLIPFTRLMAVNRDGSNPRQLGQKASFYDATLRQFDGEIVDWLPGEGGAVLMARSFVPETGRSDTRVMRRAEGLGVDRIDTATLKATGVEAPRPGVSWYMTDGRGNVRLMRMEEERADMLTGRSKYLYRTEGSRSWKELTAYVEADDFQPLAIDASINALYALKPLDGRQALYRIKLTEPTTTELAASHPRVDIDQVVRSRTGQRVVGYGFAEEKREVVHLDPEYKALAHSLRTAMKLPILEFGSASEDGNKLIVFGGSDADPGRYYLFDKATKQLNELVLARPELENRKLAEVKPVSVRAADGTMIPSYLTLPPGKEAKNLPAVVLPHGGPSSRDEWGFDWLAQYLAARGYAVLQPNYRGSSGFGSAWLMENGFKSWRTSIGDIAASARWLAEQGIADRSRLAIVGWSYGGYAALQAAATEPELFKAVAAIAPVTDLDLLKQEARHYTSGRVVAQFVGSGAHVREGSPLQRAREIKVPVLLAHGDLDLNVGIGQSLKMESALKAAGTPVQLLRYKTLDHQLDDSASRTEMLSAIGALLEKNIGR